MVYVVIFINGSEIVYHIDFSNKNPRFIPIIQKTGKKELFVINEGLMILHHDTSIGIGFYMIKNNIQKEISRYQLGNWETIELNFYKKFSPHGSIATIISIKNNPIGTILHFHGGPDSYEVEELRFFSAFRELLLEGYQLIILNYQGSKGLKWPANKSAWKKIEY